MGIWMQSSYEFKRGFVKATVSRAVRLRECPLRELRLYFSLSNNQIWDPSIDSPFGEIKQLFWSVFHIGEFTELLVFLNSCYQHGKCLPTSFCISHGFVVPLRSQAVIIIALRVQQYFSYTHVNKSFLRLVAHQCCGFCSIKKLNSGLCRSTATPLQWDANPQQNTTNILSGCPNSSPVPIYTPGWRGVL